MVPGAPARPLRGYQLRARQHLAHLARRHQVTLVTCEEGGPVPASLAGECEEVIAVRMRPWARGLGVALAGLGGEPFQAGLYRDARLRAAVGVALRRRSFDLVHVQLLRLAAALGPLAGVPVVLDLVDALSLNLRRRALLDRTPWRFVAALEARRLRSLEARLAAWAAARVVSTGRDREALGGGGVRVVPNGVDLDAFPAAPGDRQPGLVTFTGNLGYFPNVDAARWLVREVWPAVRAEVPEARLALVGARPAPALRRLARGRADIHLTGPVPDMAAALRQARVAVAPLRAGSGQPLKVLEAMASGTPVVATPAAVEGLDARSGEAILIAEDAGGLARAIVRLLVDPGLATRVATAGRALVAARHGWGQSALALEEVYREVMAARAVP